jgi:Cu2+-exporting ATPase
MFVREMQLSYTQTRFNKKTNKTKTIKPLSEKMGCESGCCGPPVPASVPAPEPAASQMSSQSDIGSCKDPCCDEDKAVTKLKDKGRATDEKTGSCCASDGCEDGKNNSGDDAPDCCRGKMSPCCNAACIDRLAIRECKMSYNTKQRKHPTL